jgi:peptidylprolyl isomerase domain and WD repeat-containing protein 1
MFVFADGMHGGIGLYTRVAVADMNGSLIRMYSVDQSTPACQHQVCLHSFPVKCLALNLVTGVVVSADAKGMIEYWKADTYGVPAGGSEVTFKYKSDTDLYALAKDKAIPTNLAMSPRGDMFVVTTLDKKIRVFDYLTGKLKRVYDESVKVYADSVAGQSLIASLSEHDMGRKQAVEKDVEASPEALQYVNAIFDESGNFLIYSSMVGIKVLDVNTSQVVRTLGGAEAAERFLAVALYQGTPRVDTQMLLARQAKKVTTTTTITTTITTTTTTTIAAATVCVVYYLRASLVWLLSPCRGDRNLKPPRRS